MQHRSSARPVDTGNFRSFPIERIIPWGVWALALLLWIFSLQSFRVREMSDLGLISIFPPSIVIAYILILLGFAYSLVKSAPEKKLLVSYLLLLVWMIHGTPQLLYGTLRYSWAWKHVGIVDYIIRHGSVNPTISVLEVYHNWPGFFAISALFTQLADLPSARAFAGWAPAFFETLFALGLLSLFRLFTPNIRLQYLAVWIFILTNWIGQDYFSPQATTYAMLIAVLVLIFLAFGSSEPRLWVIWRDRLALSKNISKPLVPVANWIVSLKVTMIPIEMEVGKKQRIALGTLLLLCLFMIVSSHQLTPIIGVEILIMLVILGYIRWRSLPVWVVVLTTLWLLGPAKAYNREILESVTGAFGQISGNINSGLINVAHVSDGQSLVSWVGRGLTLLIGLLGIAGAIRRILNKQLDLPVLLLAGLPVLTAFINSYGGELIFRVYLFSLPAISFLAAGLFLPRDISELKERNIFSISVVSMALLVGLMFGYYGKDQQYYFTQGEVDAAEFVYSRAAPNTLLIEGSRDYPSQFLNYENFIYIPLDREPADSRTNFLENPEAVFYRWMSNPDYAESYLIITRSQKISTDTLGTLPPGSLDNIQTILSNSDVFEIVFANRDAVVFVVKPRE